MDYTTMSLNDLHQTYANAASRYEEVNKKTRLGIADIVVKKVCIDIMKAVDSEYNRRLRVAS